MPTEAGYKIGATQVGMASLTSLNIPLPKSTYSKYSAYVQAASGKMIGVGSPIAAWVYGYLTQAQRDALKAFCSGASATVYIETRTVDSSDVFDQFSATMIWPQAEERDAFRRINLVIEFRNLVELT